jgi:zinc-ribbon domain
VQEVAKLASGSTLEAYQKVAVASLRQPPDLYGWIFLILSVLPVVGIVILGSRNLDRITELLFHKARVAAAGSPQNTASATVLEGRCSNCGQSLGLGVKFCPHCGAASRATMAAGAARRCSACGIENANGPQSG